MNVTNANRRSQAARFKNSFNPVFSLTRRECAVTHLEAREVMMCKGQKSERMKVHDLKGTGLTSAPSLAAPSLAALRAHARSQVFTEQPPPG